MKKIYILTAVFALLTLSLNAQLTAAKKKVVKQETSTVKVETPPDGYFRMGPSRASTEVVTTFPYINRFDSQAEWDWWEVIDANNDSYTWSLASNQARIRWNATRQANDWLITAPIHLEAGKTYKFYIDAFAQSTTYPERLEVKLASAHTASALSAGTTVIASTDVTWMENNIRTLSNENVTVSTTGDYYFGIHAISDANMYYLYVDDLMIDVEDTDPKVTVSPDQLTISDNGTNNTFNVEAHNIYYGENLGVTPHNGFSTTCTSSTNNVDTWGFYQNNGSVNGTVAVTYTGRALTASDDISVGTLGASTTVHVDYVPNLYIYCDYGASTWNFSANPAVAMINNGDGTYTAMLQNIPANSHILFGRADGLTYYWEGDGNRLFFGALTDGGDWGYGDNTSGYLDTDPYNDSPVKYHPIYFSEGGTYTITINASANTFTIDKLVYPAPENVVATADSENQKATVTWDVPSNLPTDIGMLTWDFESQSQANEWTLVNVDGDSYNWEYFTYNDGSADVFIPHSGTHCMRSASFVNNVGALNPNNWMISPEVPLGGTLTLWARGTDTNDNAEKFGVYVYQGSYSSGTNGFVQVEADKTTNNSWQSYTFDLSQYQGEGRIAIVHHNVSNMYWLMVDDIEYRAVVPIEPVSYNIYLDGQLVGSVNANDPRTYDFSNLAVGDHECAVSAVYPGGIESEAVPAQFNIMDRTAMPTISVVDNADGSKTVSATGDGTVHLYVDGVEVTNPYTIMPSSDGDITVTVTATAQEEGKLISETATQIVTVAEAGRTPTPVITVEEHNGYVVITAQGDGTVTLNAGGQTATGEGSASITIVKSNEEQTVTATATAQDGDLAESHEATKEVTIPALNTTPTNPESGLLRLHLLIVDQMKAEIPNDNSHPDKYGYVLRYEPNGPEGEGVKESGTVYVNIQKADCEVMGAYTLTEVDNDKHIGRDHDEGIKMDVISADVEYDLSGDNDMLYAYLLQGKENGVPGYQEDILTELQKTQNFTYVEMEESNPNKGREYPNGEHHFFVGEDNLKTGDYADSFISYAPSVSTWGIQRRYYEDDGYDNTYGAPIWKTAVGKVTMDDSELMAEKQQNAWNSVNWTTDAGPASLFILNGVKAIGLLPHTDIATVQYEPYMFRIFVESPSGKLRPFKVVDAVEGSATEGEHLDALVPDDELTPEQMYGPISIWDGYIQYDEDGKIIGTDSANGVKVTTKADDVYTTQTAYVYEKNKVDRPGGSSNGGVGNQDWNQDSNNARFGALDAILPANGKIDENDLKVFVRFYYAVKGEIAGHTVGTRGEGSRSGNGSESGGSAAGSATSVFEIAYHGEIVSQTYYNIQGMESDKPFDGVNIVVTRFSDGATSISKVVR